MSYLVREHLTSLIGSKTLTNFQTAHGQCGGFLNTTFKENNLKH